MGNFRYAIGRPYFVAQEGDFRAVTEATASSELSGWVKENLLQEHLATAWKANSLVNGEWAGVGLGASKSYQAVLVEDINVASFNVRAGSSLTITDDPANTTIATISGLTQNPRTKRYSTLVVASGSARWFGIVATTGTTTDGSSALKVGRITVIQTLNTMTRNWSANYSYEHDSLGSDEEFPGGQVETQSTSGIFLRFSLDGDFKITDTNEVADANAFAAVRRSDRILHFENRDDDTDKIHAYLTYQPSRVTTNERFPVIELDVELREVI